MFWTGNQFMVAAWKFLPFFSFDQQFLLQFTILVLPFYIRGVGKVSFITESSDWISELDEDQNRGGVDIT